MWSRSVALTALRNFVYGMWRTSWDLKEIRGIFLAVCVDIFSRFVPSITSRLRRIRLWIAYPSSPFPSRKNRRWGWCSSGVWIVGGRPSASPPPPPPPRGPPPFLPYFRRGRGRRGFLALLHTPLPFPVSILVVFYHRVKEKWGDWRCCFLFESCQGISWGWVGETTCDKFLILYSIEK